MSIPSWPSRNSRLSSWKSMESVLRRFLLSRFRCWNQLGEFAVPAELKLNSGEEEVDSKDPMSLHSEGCRRREVCCP